MPYVTIEGEQYVHEGETFFIGQVRVMTGSVPYIVGDRVYSDGMFFTIKNIIHANGEPIEPRSLFLCCEFDEHINGHDCRAERGGILGAWPTHLLCKSGHGEYITVEKAVKITTPVTSIEPNWEV